MRDDMNWYEWFGVPLLVPGKGFIKVFLLYHPSTDLEWIISPFLFYFISADCNQNVGKVVSKEMCMMVNEMCIIVGGGRLVFLLHQVDHLSYMLAKGIFLLLMVPPTSLYIPIHFYL